MVVCLYISSDELQTSGTETINDTHQYVPHQLVFQSSFPLIFLCTLVKCNRDVKETSSQAAAAAAASAGHQPSRAAIPPITG